MRAHVWHRNGLRGHGKLAHLTRRHRLFRYGCILFIAMTLVFTASMIFFFMNEAGARGPCWRTWSDMPLSWYEKGQPPRVMTITTQNFSTPPPRPPRANDTQSTNTSTTTNTTTRAASTNAGQTNAGPMLRTAPGQALLRLRPALAVTDDLTEAAQYQAGNKEKGGGEEGDGNGHNTDEDKGQEEAANDPLLPAAAAPAQAAQLSELRVQMLRTRRTRQTWAEDKDGVVEPIVGLVPSEDASLYFPHEVLVEEYGNDEDGLRRKRDARMYIPMEVRSVPGNTQAVRRGEGEDKDEEQEEEKGGLQSVMLRAHTGEDGATEYRTHVHICTRAAAGLRPARHTSHNNKDDVCRAGYQTRDKAHSGADSAAFMVWHSGAGRSAVTVQLALQPPTRNTATDVADMDEANTNNEAEQGEDAEKKMMMAATSTQALFACLSFARVRRLYGLPGRSRHGGLDLPRHNFSRLILIGDTHAAGHGEEYDDEGGEAVMQNGVIPLLYVETEEKGEVAKKKNNNNKDAENELGRSTHYRLTRGIFWLHAAPFYIHITTDAAHDRTRICLRSTAGATRLYLLPGPSEQLVRKQYFTLTGFPLLPPRFMLGYHGGTHNALTSMDRLRQRGAQYEAQHVPLTALWLSNPSLLTKGTPFTWNRTRVASPVVLQRDLWRHGRTMLLFPAIPSVSALSYSPLYQEAVRHEYLVNERATRPMPWFHVSAEGMVSHLIDFVSPAARVWYGGLLKYKRFAGSTNHTFLRLRHAGPFISGGDGDDTRGALKASRRAGREDAQVLRLPMQLAHYGGVTQHQVHHVWPLHYAMAAQYGLVRRTRFHRRGLVVTEEYFAGTQRAAVVALSQSARNTGYIGNTEKSPSVHKGVTRLQRLRRALRRCLSLNVMGLPYVGFNLADAFAASHTPANCTSNHTEEAVRIRQQQQQHQDETELLRWFQAAMLMPLMYAEEPAQTGRDLAAQGARGVAGDAAYASTSEWLLRGQHAAALAARQLIRLRYSFLPTLYTALWQSSVEGRAFVSYSSTAVRSANGAGDEDITRAPQDTTNNEEANVEKDGKMTVEQTPGRACPRPATRRHARTEPQVLPVLCFYIGRDFLSCPIVQPDPQPESKAQWSMTLPTLPDTSGNGGDDGDAAGGSFAASTVDQFSFVDYWSGMRYAAGASIYLGPHHYFVMKDRRGLTTLPFWLQSSTDGLYAHRSRLTTNAHERRQEEQDDGKEEEEEVEGRAFVSMSSITAPLFVRVGAVVVHAIYSPHTSVQQQYEEDMEGEDSTVMNVATPSVQRAMNFSLVLTLPPIQLPDIPADHTRTAAPVIAQGVMYWDEGTLNDQTPPSQSWLARKTSWNAAPVTAGHTRAANTNTTTTKNGGETGNAAETYVHAPHCEVVLQAAVTDRHTLTITGTQRSASCGEVVRALHAMWRESGSGSGPALAGGIDAFAPPQQTETGERTNVHEGTDTKREVDSGLFVRHVRLLLAREEDAERVMVQCSTAPSTTVSVLIEHFDTTPAAAAAAGDTNEEEAAQQYGGRNVVYSTAQVQLRRLRGREVIVSFDVQTALSLFGTDGTSDETRGWRLRLPLARERCSH